MNWSRSLCKTLVKVKHSANEKAVDKSGRDAIALATEIGNPETLAMLKG
jgi:hypothetical protein